MTRRDDDIDLVLRRLHRIERKLERVQTYLVATIVLATASLLLSFPTWMWVVLGLGAVLVLGRLVWLVVKPDVMGRDEERES